MQPTRCSWAAPTLTLTLALAPTLILSLSLSLSLSLTLTLTLILTLILSRRSSVAPRGPSRVIVWTRASTRYLLLWLYLLWLHLPLGMDARLDVLFVEEAGQLPLAHLIGAAILTSHHPVRVSEGLANPDPNPNPNSNPNPNPHSNPNQARRGVRTP